jgi:hypothetical protein
LQERRRAGGAPPFGPGLFGRHHCHPVPFQARPDQDNCSVRIGKVGKLTASRIAMFCENESTNQKLQMLGVLVADRFERFANDGFEFLKRWFLKLTPEIIATFVNRHLRQVLMTRKSKHGVHILVNNYLLEFASV